MSFAAIAAVDAPDGRVGPLAITSAPADAPSPAGVTPPTLTYVPTYDADGVGDATAEVVFPTGTLGSSSETSVVPTATGGAAVSWVTMSCATTPTAFTIASGGTTQFDAPTTGTVGPPIVMRCALAGAVQTGTLTCTETDTPGGAMRTRTWDLLCPAAEANPEFSSLPASGGTLTLTAAASSVATGAVVTQNSGAGPLAITGCVASAGFTVGTVTSPVPPFGGTGEIGVSCTTPAQPGTNFAGSLTCATQDSDEPQANYNLVCSAQATGGTSESVPTFGHAALLLLMFALVAVAFVARR